MRRFIASAATAAVLLTGCVVDVEEEGVDTATVDAETLGGMEEIGLDPDDCFPDGLIPDGELEDDFGVYHRIITIGGEVPEPQLYRR